MRAFNQDTRRWEYTDRLGYDGSAWLDVMRGDQDNAVQLTSMFDHEAGQYLGKGTILQRDITNMPVHPDSGKMSEWMDRWSPFGPSGGWALGGDKTGLNTSSFGTQPIHAYVVDSTHPDCYFQNLDATAASTPTEEIDLYMKGKFPFPSWATGARNGDYGCAIYDKGTGIMREVFMFRRKTDAQGNEILDSWGGGGGYSIASPGLKNLATENYALQQRRGISNVAGMHNSLGFIGISEVLNKKIEHALCFTAATSWSVAWTPEELLAERRAILASGKSMPTNWPNQQSHGHRFSWPARAGDGKAERYIPESTWTLAGGQSKTYTGQNLHITPMHGQWGRLPKSVDPWFNPRTGRPYYPLTRLLIEAAQNYGLTPTDTNLFIPAFNAEQGRTWEHMYGADPWKADGLIDRFLRDPWQASPGSGIAVGDFPWHLVEWATEDWGRPSPDWNIRPGEWKPWWSPTDPRRPEAASRYY